LRFRRGDDGLVAGFAEGEAREGGAVFGASVLARFCEFGSAEVEAINDDIGYRAPDSSTTRAETVITAGCAQRTRDRAAARRRASICLELYVVWGRLVLQRVLAAAVCALFCGDAESASRGWHFRMSKIGWKLATMVF